MNLRDEIETTLRAWHAYETGRGSVAVIDFDCAPTTKATEPASSRLAVYQSLTDLRARTVEAGADRLTTRLTADIAYLGALMGEHPPLNDYVQATQGCLAAGWQDIYITHRGDRAREALAALGIGWGADTARDLNAIEGPIETDEAPDAIRQAADEYETAVRQVTGSQAPFNLTIETTEVDAYWAYWLDGAGDKVRLRLNLRRASFTKVAARQFALHEVLGHGLQGASWSARAAADDVPWVRLMSVHAPQQVLLEGLAQALPLFIAPDDELLGARTRFDHYSQLVRAELHIALNQGASIAELADHARYRMPWTTEAAIADVLTDRGVNPQLRSYLWAYPAGIDWFANLADADRPTRTTVLQAAYRDPLTPNDLAALWPAGPAIGG
ncbi:hypothetical protein E1293_38060 [Actinomadura darangshiensis]|uniref:DUF1704 domain-containing protein n=1 Tax=Actinomadura darangshiensis TaxID=705336 RepID=A0A4R5A9S3_9ACTN|nr:hypothetical protein [Actinomadura darangshiensis]TDD67444.1 hypothetical protein E1293_38060 [Actinomadura darangshiensis]